MTGGFKISVCAGAALLLLAGCERPSAVADSREPAAQPQAFASREAPRNRSGDEAEQQVDHRTDPVPEVDGKPMWSASRRYSAEENAERAFARNGETFGARDVDDFVRKAHAFVQRPPRGVLTLERPNGDRLFYDPKANVFAVATKEGAPRTMFKPDDGMAYWEQQKAREAQRQARSGASSADEG